MGKGNWDKEGSVLHFIINVKIKKNKNKKKTQKEKEKEKEIGRFMGVITSHTYCFNCIATIINVCTFRCPLLGQYISLPSTAWNHWA